MAKVPFSKLTLKINSNIVPAQIGEVTIGVRQYLPVEDKLALIARVIENAHDVDQNFANPIKMDVYKVIEVVKAYTDIAFTEKQLENIPELYDKLISSGAWKTISEVIPRDELADIDIGIYDTSEAYYKYRNSILGILDNVQTDYSDMNLKIEDLAAKINDPNVTGFVKELLSKTN